MTMRGLQALAALLVLAGANAVHAQTTRAEPSTLRTASIARWDGVWVAENMEAEISGLPSIGPVDRSVFPRIFVLVGFAAPWNETGWARFEAMVARAPNSKAYGWGYPLMMGSPAPLQFVITPTETVIMNIYREARYIYTDGRPHPPAEDRWLTAWGDSVGRWEGDTLVVDTTGVKAPASVRGLAPPLSEQARYVERLRMVSPGRIESDITIEDPITLTGPWHTKVAYRRAAGMDRIAYDTMDNDRTGDGGEFFTIEPTAKPKPAPVTITSKAEVTLSDAELNRVVGRYEFTPNRVLTVKRQGKLLLAGVTGDPFLPIHADAPLRFALRVAPVRFEFTTDAAGEVTGVVMTEPSRPTMTGKRL